jgi:hypothetical protein
MAHWWGIRVFPQGVKRGKICLTWRQTFPCKYRHLSPTKKWGFFFALDKEIDGQYENGWPFVSLSVAGSSVLEAKFQSYLARFCPAHRVARRQYPNRCAPLR